MVGTLGRTQPADRGCAAAPLPPAGPARDLCSIDAYAERVVERAEDAAVAAKPLGGNAAGGRALVPGPGRGHQRADPGPERGRPARWAPSSTARSRRRG